MFARPYNIRGSSLSEVTNSGKAHRKSNFGLFAYQEKTSFSELSNLGQIFEAHSHSREVSIPSLNDATAIKHSPKSLQKRRRHKFISSQLCCRLKCGPRSQVADLIHQENVTLSRFKILVILMITKLITLLMIQVRLSLRLNVTGLSSIEAFIWAGFGLLSLLIRVCLALFLTSNTVALDLFAALLISLSNSFIDMALGKMISNTVRSTAD